VQGETYSVGDEVYVIADHKVIKTRVTKVSPVTATCLLQYGGLMPHEVKFTKGGDRIIHASVPFTAVMSHKGRAFFDTASYPHKNKVGSLGQHDLTDWEYIR